MGISPELHQRMKAIRSQISQHTKQKDDVIMPGAEVGIVTLGTGGSLPSKYRNGLPHFYPFYLKSVDLSFLVLSTLIRIPFWGNILLDTGEGTWGQMARHFGLDKNDENSAWHVLRDLKCIFVSHMHADHHIGLAQILAKRQLVRDLERYTILEVLMLWVPL